MTHKAFIWKKTNVDKIEQAMKTIFEDSYIGKESTGTFVIKIGEEYNEELKQQVPYYANVSVIMKESLGCVVDETVLPDGSRHINSKKTFILYDGERNVRLWNFEQELEKERIKIWKQNKIKKVLEGLPDNMKQELLAALLSELKGE